MRVILTRVLQEHNSVFYLGKIGKGSVFINFRFTATLQSITAVRSKNGLYKEMNQILLNK